MLQMAGLRFDEQPIDHGTIPVRERRQIHAEANEREQIHRLARAEHMAVLENAVGATDLVEELAGIGLEELFPRVELVLDDRLEHGAETLDDLLFGLAKRRLVGNLKDA